MEAEVFNTSTRYVIVEGRQRGHIVLATKTDVAVEETDLPGADKDTGEVSESPLDAIETNEDSSAKSDGSSTTARSKRTRPIRKSDMPPIRTEDLIPGATYVTCDLFVWQLHVNFLE